MEDNITGCFNRKKTYLTRVIEPIKLYFLSVM